MAVTTIVSSNSLTDVATILSAAAAILYFLDVVGLVGWARRRISRRRVVAARHPRFWSSLRIAGFVGLGVSVALGFAANERVKVALALLLVAVFIAREYLGWHHEVEEDAPLEPGELTAPPPATTGSLPAATSGPVQGHASAPAPVAAPKRGSQSGSTPNGPRPPRATYTVSNGVVELRLANVPSGLIGPRKVVCTVIAPDGRESVARPLMVNPIAGPLGATMANMFGAKTAIVQYPTDFDDSPPLTHGLYRVTWEETYAVPIQFDPQRTFASFRYE
jgi:hypothetical protein